MYWNSNGADEEDCTVLMYWHVKWSGMLKRLVPPWNEPFGIVLMHAMHMSNWTST